MSTFTVEATDHDSNFDASNALLFGDPLALFMANRRLVHWCLYHLLQRNLIDPDDLIQEGEIGLWRAAKGFNPARGTFAAYAIKAIKRHAWNAVQREWRQLRKSVQGSSNDPDDLMTVERMAVMKTEPVEDDVIDDLREVLQSIEGLQGERLRGRAAGLSAREIAAAQGTSHQAVFISLGYAYRKVRAGMKELNPRWVAATE